MSTPSQFVGMTNGKIRTEAARLRNEAFTHAKGSDERNRLMAESVAAKQYATAGYGSGK